MMQLLGRVLDGIHGRRVLIDGELVHATVKIKNGRISEVIRHTDANMNRPLESSSETYLDAGELIVMPSIFDSHVHVNEPGRTSWEGFESATKAALAGGITTIIDMPLNSIPPTTTMENLIIKMESTKGKCHTDVGFWGGVVPDNVDSLRPMIEKGVIGFKCFLIHSGVEEFPCVDEDEVDQALEQIKGTNAVLAFHAEMDCATCINSQVDPKQYSTFLASRPDEMELEAIKMIDRQLRKHKNVRCHIVHISSARSLPIIEKLKEDGFPITVETCPHYLTLSPDEISPNQTQYKCCPPIRDNKNQDDLWDGLRTGKIDMIVSDHSPCTSDLKKPGEKNFMEAWGGISSLQFGLSIIWSQAKKRGFEVKDLSRWMSAEPARLAGMSNRKGKIDVDFDADFVIWDDEASFEIAADDIQHKNKLTPYVGKRLTGKVASTVLRGRVAYADGSFATAKGALLIN